MNGISLSDLEAGLIQAVAAINGSTNAIVSEKLTTAFLDLCDRLWLTRRLPPPPNDLDAELEVVATACLGFVPIGLESRDFFDRNHAFLFEVTTEFRAEGIRTTLPSIRKAAVSMGAFEPALDALLDRIAESPISTKPDHLVKRIKKLAVRRRVLAIVMELESYLRDPDYDDDQEIAELLRKAAEEVNGG